MILITLVLVGIGLRILGNLMYMLGVIIDTISLK